MLVTMPTLITLPRAARGRICGTGARRGTELAKPLSCATYGYTVFGRVIDGMETVFDIELVETGLDDDRMDVPLEPSSSGRSV